VKARKSRLKKMGLLLLQWLLAWWIWPQGILATICVVIFALRFLAGTNRFKYSDWWWEQQPWSEIYWRQLGKEIQDTQIEHDLCMVKKQAACCRPFEMNGRTARMKTF
jgi:hypothetical protein